MSGQLEILVGQARLAYRRLGDPDAPPLLLHVLGDEGGTWEPVAEFTAAALDFLLR